MKLKKQTEARTEALVAAGNFATPDDVVNRALDLYEELVREEEDLRSKIRAARAELDRGEFLTEQQILEDLARWHSGG